jgi:hypothetical protein
MGNYWRARREREHRVKGSYAVNFRGRQVHAHGDVVDCTQADPADTRLNGVQDRKQEIATGRRRNNHAAVIPGGLCVN